MRPAYLALFCAVLALGLVAAVFLNRGGQAVITVDASQSFQTLTGWESSADLPNNPTSPNWRPYHDQATRIAVDAGINRIRLEITAGVESHSGFIRDMIAGKAPKGDLGPMRYDAQNDNDDPFTIDPSGFDFTELDWHMAEFVLPLQKVLAERGERLWINLLYVCFRKDRIFQIEPEEYAELILATYQHLQDTYGILPDSLELILEPDKSGAWTGEDIGRAMVATANRLTRHGFPLPDFVAPSVMDMRSFPAYADGIASIPGTKGLWKELSYHRYGGELTREIAARAAELGLQTSMLEFWFGRGTPEVLFKDVGQANAAAWQGRALPGLYDVVQKDPPRLALREDVRLNAQLFRAARLGAVRIGATSSNPDQFTPLAFRNPSGGQALVILARQRGLIRVEGLAPGIYAPSFATAHGSVTLRRFSVARGQPVTLSMPAPGLFTLKAAP